MAVISQNQAFQINDQVFSVGPTAIQVQKENLSYRWHVLRQSSSTKIPTAHGGLIVQISIPIPREDILKLHRLIIQFKQNPFAYIENRYLRDEIVPHWPSTQSMAFTLLNLSVQNVVGNVGLFMVNLQMQWFNYFPYTHNLWFREEWETDWIPVNNLTDLERENLPYLLSYKVPEEGVSISHIKKSIFDYITDQTENPPADAHVKATAGDLEEQLKDWQGFVFDLLPLPAGMLKASPVKDPRASRIYVRYYNELQNRALLNNFGIDLNSYEWLGGRDYYQGLLSGTGDNSGAVTLPEYTSLKNISGSIISKMMAHDDFTLTFNTYKFVDLPPSVLQALNVSTNKLIENTQAFVAGALDAGLDPSKITSGFGDRFHPVLKKWKHHDGTDYGYSSGTPIKSIADGTVIKAVQNDPIDGNYVIVQHAANTTSSYSHFSSITVSQGQQVTKNNEILGLVGSTGRSTGSHLHLGVRINGKSVDPAKWLADQQLGIRTQEPISNIGPTSEDNEDLSEDIGGSSKPFPKESQTSTNPQSPEPWYTALDNMNQNLTEDDQAFFKSLANMITAGYRYYSQDPTINGVFYKPITIKIPGHGPFSGSTDSHNTILTKINGTLRHIVAAIPILGHEFPTHQHLGATDATYGFEFVTLDHSGLRDGMGGGAKLLEAARITLQQNGRSIRHIYDSWMAQGDNFITRLFGTYDNFGPHDKKLIIASTQAGTVEGQPGSSVLVMNCEETLSYVNEQLDKVNSASASDFEAIYRKIIEKIREVVKKAAVSPRIASLNAAKKKMEADIPNLEDTPDQFYTKFNDLAINAIGLFGAKVGAPLIDSLSNDQFDVDGSKDPIREVGADFYELDTSRVSGLTEQDVKELGNIIAQISYLLLAGQLIAMEESVGGYKQSSGDSSSTTYNLFGAEKLLVPKGNKMIAYSQNHWGPFIENIGKYLGVMSSFLTKGISNQVLGGSEDLYNLSNDAVNTQFYGYTPFGVSPGAEAGAGTIPKNFIELIFNPIIRTYKTAQEAILFDATLMDPAVSEVIIRSYLLELYNFTGDFNTVFTGSTTEYGIARLNQILPANPDNSPLLRSQFGLVSSVLSAIDHRINNSSLGYITQTDWERNKFELIKSQLIETLQPIFNKPNLMKFFNIEEDVSALLYKVIRDEKDALPDLDLPPHPYWGKTYLTSPDFYYFNYHEDGVYTSSSYSTYDTLSDKYVDGIYNFMNTWTKEGLHLDMSGNFTGGEVQESPSRDIGVEFDGYDHIADAAYPSQLKKVGFTATDIKEPVDKLKFFESDNSGSGSIAAPFQPSNFDRDILYIPIATNDLKEKIKGVEWGFGRKEGYANERNEINKISNASKVSLNGEAEDTAFTHFYGVQDLKDIVKESKKDLLSQKFTMKRAWPTFRLYFIEEDQTEDFLMRYDDFYHYNAIKEIIVTRSRTIAGDTAVIVMQNIAGILDGSKRNVLKDTDFLVEQKNADGTLNRKGRSIEESRKVSNRDTAQEESVGSIVLRPGVNMQLRMGYGNDPNALEVKLSGRVVDVSYSENSDLVEITIQSFGVELEQVQKGLDPNQESSYDLTHKLLGALMLSPELIHFGRWEVGTQFQFGESKNAQLDFRKYKSNEMWNKLTGIYFANTANQLRDFYESVNEKSLLLYHTTGNGQTFIGTVVNNFNVFSSLSDSIQVGAAFAWDTLTFPIKASIDNLSKRFTNEIITKKAYAMNEPQDDNLYPPNPKDYILRPNWFWRVFKDSVNTGLERRTIKDGFTKGVVETFKALTSQKLSFNDLTYTLDNVTIWQVFHEMTLRHPNYIYGPVPYGKEFRYTMFFGVPSQRYWSKPAHPFFIARTNETRKGVATDLGDASKEQGEKSVFGSTYAISDLNKVFKHNRELNQPVAGGGTFSGNSPAFADQAPRNTNVQVNAGLNVSEEIKQQRELLAKLGFSSVREALLEYYTALTLRFEPFRRYHMVTSETDLIANNLSISEYNVANAVAVKYFDNEDKENEGIKMVKMHDRIPDEEIRLIRAPDYPNVSGELLALRYAVGQLIYEAKEMYSGSILTIGNSRIKPWDICIIVDKYNDIVGPIEVEQVVERLSFDTGYITEIKPNAVVFANEISSFPILEGLKAFIAARTKEQDAIYSTYSGNDFFNDIASAGFSTIESVDRDLGTEFLQGRNARALSAFSQEEVVRLLGIPELRSSTPMQSTLASMAWLIGGYFYINKCLDNQSIIVYPLLKNGIPMVAGIPSAQPETLWSITFGQVNSFVDDVTKGTSEFLSRWKLLGVESYRAFTNDGPREQKVAEATDLIRP